MNDGVREAPDYRVVVDRPHLLRRLGRILPIVTGPGQTLLAWHNLKFWADFIAETAPEAKDWLQRLRTFEMKTHHPRQRPWDYKTGIMWAYNGSPFVACNIAAWMGCERIGVIGVDMAGDSLKLRKDVNFQYERLRILLGRDGIDLVRLQDDGPLESLPTEDAEMFATMAP